MLAVVAGCVVALAVLVLTRGAQPRRVASSGVAALVTVVAGGLLIGIHWQSLRELYDFASTHSHATTFRQVGWTSAAIHGVEGLAAVAVVLVGEAYVVAGRLGRRDVTGLGNLVWLGVVWITAFVFLVDPAERPSDRQLVFAAMIVVGCVVIALAVRLLWGVVLKTGVEWRAPQSSGLPSEPAAPEVRIEPEGQDAFALRALLESYRALVALASVPPAMHDVPVGVSRQLDRARHHFEVVVALCAGIAMVVVTALARAGSATSPHTTEAAVAFGVVLAVLWLLGHVARPAGALTRLEQQIPSSEPGPPALVPLPQFCRASEDVAEARIRVQVPAARTVPCESCGGAGGREVVIRVRSSGYYGSGSVANNPAAVNAGYAPPSSPGEVYVPGGTSKRREWVSCPDCDGEGTTTRAVSPDEAGELASECAQCLSACARNEQQIRDAVAAENARRVAQWQMELYAWTNR